jgi:hypothetical protein
MIVYHEVGGSALPSGKGFGMTMRDYFAAQAMQGMLAACTGWSDAYQERMAKASYKMADEMLKARDD